MPRLTRKSIILEAEAKVNIVENGIATETTPKHPRLTRKSIKLEAEAKENIAASENIATETTPKQPLRRSKRQSPSSSSSESTPSKSSRSNSLSPFRNQFAEQLKIATPKGNNLRSARRALTDNSEFRLPGREKEFDELTSYLKDLIDTNASGSLYIMRCSWHW